MATDRSQLIESWFAERDDGEFSLAVRSVPYSVIVPSSPVGRVIFTTKPRIISTIIENSEAPTSFGLVGRYGLPNEADVRWLSESFGSRGLMFLGDMDPVDLMIFVWLRECLPARRIAHLGLRDDFLEKFDLPSLESFVIPCESAEREAVCFLDEIFPDYREMIGPRCVRFLEAGRKIELEVMLSAKLPAALVLQAAVLAED